MHTLLQSPFDPKSNGAHPEHVFDERENRPAFGANVPVQATEQFKISSIFAAPAAASSAAGTASVASRSSNASDAEVAKLHDLVAKHVQVTELLFDKHCPQLVTAIQPTHGSSVIKDMVAALAQPSKTVLVHFWSYPGAKGATIGSNHAFLLMRITSNSWSNARMVE
jgi:hypothetical protein